MIRSLLVSRNQVRSLGGACRVSCCCCETRRTLSSSSYKTKPTKGAGVFVFDRDAKRRQRDWVARQSDADVFWNLKKEVGFRVADRIPDITQFFPVAVDLGSFAGHIAPHVYKENVGHLIQVEMSPELMKRSLDSDEVLTSKLVADEELLELRQQSVDLLVSSLSLHWVNDLPEFFNRCFRALRPDGALIAAVFGGDTLYELRCSLQLADMERLGGIASHVSPLTKAEDISFLLNRAGFSMVTLDTEDIVVGFPDMWSLMVDLQGMAESAAAWTRCPHLRTDISAAAAAIYKEMYGKDDGSLPATFDIIYFIGWKPGPNMNQPAAKGSATVSFKDIEKFTKE